MKSFISITKYLFIFFITLSLVSGCALKKKAEPETGPVILLERGLTQMDSGALLPAANLFQAVRDRYPYSKEAITASLKLADTLYRRGDYDTAYSLYDEFERLHPRNENIPYVVYQKGMCYFVRIRSYDRDQIHTRRARDEFERLLRLHPRSEYVNLARRNLRESMALLAKHELYVGHFYFRNGQYEPALNRFINVIENYPDLGQHHEALIYISKCNEKLAHIEE